MTGLSAVPYFGGKSANARGVNQWINSLLPPFEWDSTYVETHYGQGGIHLSRPRAKLEIANDLSDRIWNFWTVVRNQGEEFG